MKKTTILLSFIPLFIILLAGCWSRISEPTYTSLFVYKNDSSSDINMKVYGGSGDKEKLYFDLNIKPAEQDTIPHFGDGDGGLYPPLHKSVVITNSSEIVIFARGEEIYLRENYEQIFKGNHTETMLYVINDDTFK